MGFWNNITDGINDVFNEIFQFILVLLPDSPFKDFSLPPEIENFLGYLNYYIPFAEMVAIGLVWITCVSVFYSYQLILRFINAIK